METTTFTIRKVGSLSVFEAETDYFIERLADAYYSTKSRKEKAVIREKYVSLVRQENAKAGFKRFNTVL